MPPESATRTRSDINITTAVIPESTTSTQSTVSCCHIIIGVECGELSIVTVRHGVETPITRVSTEWESVVCWSITNRESCVLREIPIPCGDLRIETDHTVALWQFVQSFQTNPVLCWWIAEILLILGPRSVEEIRIRSSDIIPLNEDGRIICTKK